MKAAPAKKPRQKVKAAVVEETAAATDTTHLAVSFDVLRQQIAKLVTDDALDMVRKTIDHAKNGQYQALKYLFEMVGLYPATTDEETPQEDSLAKILLKRLGISEESDPAIESGRKPVAAQLDAVE
jgi:hypothetical protein